MFTLEIVVARVTVKIDPSMRVVMSLDLLRMIEVRRLYMLVGIIEVSERLRHRL